jgi:hypothetical protein
MLSEFSDKNRCTNGQYGNDKPISQLHSPSSSPVAREIFLALRFAREPDKRKPYQERDRHLPIISTRKSFQSARIKSIHRSGSTSGCFQGSLMRAVALDIDTGTLKSYFYTLTP